MALRLELVTPDNVLDACALKVEPWQEKLVASVAVSLAQAYGEPAAWPRVIYDGDRFAVEEVAAEARRRGQARITVLWVPGPGGAEKFYLRLGFTPTGQTFDGQVVGALKV